MLLSKLIFPTLRYISCIYYTISNVFFQAFLNIWGADPCYVILSDLSFVIRVAEGFLAIIRYI